MFNLTKKLGLAALLAFGAVSSASASVLDTFDYDVDLTQNGIGQISSAKLVGVTETLPAPGDVQYTLKVTKDLLFANDAQVIASQSEGVLSLSVDSGVAAMLTMDYTDIDAFAPIDLTDGGTATHFYFDILGSDEGFKLDIFVTDIFDNTSHGWITSPEVTFDDLIPERIFMNFNVFTGVANFSLVKAITAVITAPSDSDLTISEVGTIPEPTTVAILGLGLLGFAASRRRKA